MGKYFKVFKLNKSNISGSSIIVPTLNNSDKYIYFADLLNSTKYISRSYHESIDGFFQFNYIRENYRFLNTWVIVLYRCIGENIKEIIEDLYTELGSLENPVEEQIGCYTFTINMLNGTGLSDS